jgi:hypothetical protein
MVSFDGQRWSHAANSGLENGKKSLAGFKLKEAEDKDVLMPGCTSGAI